VAIDVSKQRVCRIGSATATTTTNRNAHKNFPIHSIELSINQEAEAQHRETIEGKKTNKSIQD
jgi:hypothetical protein